MKKIIFPLITLLSLLAGQALAFQYDGFYWGMSREKAVQFIKDKHKKPVVAGDTVYYKDTIFDAPCKITLFFTEKNDLLHTVQISCPSPGAGPLFAKKLNELHGSAIREDQGVDRYIWAGETENDTLALDYSQGSTELYYGAGADQSIQSYEETGDTF